MRSPLGRDSDVTAGAGVTVKVKDWLVAVTLRLSVTVNMRPDAVVAVGESGPAVMPAELGVRPAGRVPLVRAHVYGGVPPEAARATPPPPGGG